MRKTETTITQQRDVIVNTTIYEHDRKKRYDGRKRLIVLTAASVVLAIGMIITVGVLQQNEYDAYMNDDEAYLNFTLGFCYVVDFKNFDALSTPIAAFLLIIFIILYQRRSFLRKKCSFSYIGLPMVVSCFNKTDRIYTGIVYGRIAFEVFNILYDTFNGNGSTVTVPGDPTGLFSLLMKVIEMFLIGIRYYPILVACRVNTPVVYVFSAVYMWIDFASTVYQTGVCDGISSQEAMDQATALFEHDYWIAYKVLMSIPTFVLSSFICTNLTYRAIASIIDLRKRTSYKKDCCISIFNINDKHEIFYSPCDIDYVLNLFRNRNTIVKCDEKIVGVNNYSSSIKQKIKILFKKHVYEWNPSFRFSSRFVSCHIVAIIALYYFFLFFLYEVGTLILELVAEIPDNFSITSLDINFGSILCTLNEDMCSSNLENVSYSVPLPESVIKFLPEFKRSIISVFIAPMFFALLICVIQFLLSIKDTKHHLIQLYKGECDFVPRRKLLSNSSIASSSFHYGGYVVGYLIWGFLLQYLFILLIGLIIIFMRMFIGDKVFENFLLKLVPVVCGFVAKKIVNVIASNYVFLNRHSKILSLDNFRAFNVFLYFSFFFDCFMGFVSAFIRIIKSAVANIFMMPRISYGFLGRHLERSDNGYGTYIGYLHLEAAHTNPILISFCSLLYYEGLSVQIKEHLRQNSHKKVPKFRGIAKEKVLHIDLVNKQYKRHVVNKWHVMIMLIKNPVLVQYRQKTIITTKI